MSIRLYLATLLATLLSSCGHSTYYSSGAHGTIFWQSSGNYGIVTTENVSNQSGVATGFTGNVGGNRAIAAIAVPSEIRFHDGTVIRGPIDHSTQSREGGNALKNVTGIKALRDIWMNGIDSIESISSDIIKNQD